jgi:multiple sugar transport system substrate-binding protein
LGSPVWGKPTQNGVAQMKLKVRKIALILLSFMILISIYFLVQQNQENDDVLEFGMFVGSNWQVENANSYILIDSAVKKFEKENPGVKVHYYSGITRNDYSEWLARKIIMGETPDVFMVLTEDFTKLSSLGVLKDMDDLIEKDEDFDPSKYFSTSWESGHLEGSQYALPFESVPTLMFVNTTMLDKNNIQVPKNDWTWNDLYEISKKVTKDTNGDGKIDQFGTLNYNWIEAVYSNNGNIFDDLGQIAFFTNERVIESVKYVSKLQELNERTTVSEDDFNSGNVAFMPLLFSDYRTYKTYPYKIKKYTNFKWDFMTLPAGEHGNNVSEVKSLIIGMNEKTKKEKLAWEFIKLLTYDEEIQMNIFKYSQGSSVLKTVTKSKEAEELLMQYTGVDERVIDNQLLSEIIENGVIAPKFQEYDKVINLADSEVNDIILRSNDIDSSMKILQRTVLKYLD